MMHKSARVIGACGAATVLCLLVSFSAWGSVWARDPFHVLLVDKAKHQLHMAEYLSDRISILKSFHVTLGKAHGDKEVEKDLKTPEGIYFFKAWMRPPSLKKKFGALAIMMDYPNTIDRMAGKTGYDIMLHATDDPPRLKKDYDSEGCVVIDNHEIEEVAKTVRLGLTPIIVYPELKPDYLSAAFKPELHRAFETWVGAWSGKDIDGYIGSYAGKFRYNNMNLRQYRAYKSSLNQRYALIRVNPTGVRYFYHPKYDVVMFTQNYESRLKSGAKGFKSSGTKLLYFVREGDRYKIAAEEYTSLKE